MLWHWVQRIDGYGRRSDRSPVRRGFDGGWDCAQLKRGHGVSEAHRACWKNPTQRSSRATMLFAAFQELATFQTRNPPGPTADRPVNQPLAHLALDIDERNIRHLCQSVESLTRVIMPDLLGASPAGP